MQNELKPISFYEKHPECVPYGEIVQEFKDAVFVPYADGFVEAGDPSSCLKCCLDGHPACYLAEAACVAHLRDDGQNGYFILKSTGPAMATAGFSYGSMGEEVQ